MDFHHRIDIEDKIEWLHLMAVANSGDGKFINKLVKDLQKLI
jgi:hypothetical protein